MKSVAEVPNFQLNSQDTPPVVVTTGLRKVYRTGFFLNQKVVSLKNCSLTVYKGETFGLLGPNGAGKTTLLKLLLGMIRPTSGRGLLLGSPLGDRNIRERIGYLPENAYLYDYLTGWEFLQAQAGLFQIPKRVQRERIPYLLELVGLSKADARKKQMRRYSKGMLQRVAMAQALINDPEVVFLDEPMSGLDPIGRYQMREIILALKAEGKTIFFNSHILSEVEQVCDRVAILNQGELICHGSLDQLLGTHDTYEVKGQGGDWEILKKWFSSLEFAPDGSWQGKLQGDYYDFLASLRLMGGQIISMRLFRPTLEEFFIKTVKTGVNNS
ncbi:ABC transporter ATP-binding protein [Aetokthonos hydrillicola Thurmond2011]|jgi:ABC-2 type transport system ATP-binding protein|uniref:ABC transporter ATP-binding protein n=1 Tax=Aetokthonos hydrillicola Thurmond2011 TaxID=2712845 RepID=A0AAP5MCM9_9CYAN|nr:ABC transporter ATP-binding protein [Aetokthonos hydrillicola]MBO3462910.1 ABC transporter ATP-binding protein [Aetokthonos hydrillicola CCALA 1050]MBW4584258.1 ABC transporter ATP-binding protein [Aetokthonos hydrillicola CCALA 1050]MDR9898533.1 ABC transporter ATP-binding protein [Aetokthonos hydrillicola Thurmond2011]